MISIVVINYRTYELTRRLLVSIFEHTENVDFEIILLDNFSDDGSFEKLESDFADIKKSGIVKMVKNPINGGFAYASNIGIKIAKGEVIVLINSDVVILDNIFHNLWSEFECNGHDTIIGPKVILPDGSFEHGCKRGFPTPFNSIIHFLRLDEKIKFNKINSYKMSEVHEDEDSEVDAISGCFFAIPTKIIADIGLLDEDFFMYGEDLDWCYRAKMVGYKVLYRPSIGTVKHYHAQSGKKLKMKVLYEFHRAMAIYYRKHESKKRTFFFDVVVYFAIYFLFIIKLIREIVLKTLKL